MFKCFMYVCNTNPFKTITMCKKFIFMTLSIAFILSASAQDIKLSPPNKNDGKPLMQALSERRSTREFNNKDLR